jgi:bifunctional non-homologous end joining protein LigD
VTSIVIDGEAMCFTGATHDFDKLWNRMHDHEARLYAFDLLEPDGEDYRSKPLAERKKKLFRLIRRAWRGIEYVEHLEGDGAVFFEHACKLGWKVQCASGSTCPIVCEKASGGATHT